MVAYPHPVIGNGDDVASSFEVPSVDHQLMGPEVKLWVEVRCDDPDVRELLSSGKAFLALRLMCGRTFYNNTKRLSPQLTPDGWSSTVSVDAQLLDGPADAYVLLITDEPVDRFMWRNQHPEFMGASFDLPEQTVIGTAGPFKFDVRKSYDPLKPPLESYMRIRPAPEGREEEFFVTVTAEGIDVYVRANLYEGFGSLGFNPSLQFNSVLLPALMQAIIQIEKADPEDEVQQSDWCKGLLRELSARGLGVQTSVLLKAQSMLSNPFSKMLNSGLIETAEGDPDVN